jgi:hypothetical protein
MWADNKLENLFALEDPVGMPFSAIRLKCRSEEQVSNNGGLKN